MIRIFDIEMVTENNDINNDYNIFSNDLDGQEENLFNQQIDKELEVIPKTTLNPKVIRVVKNLQASYNKNANKIVKQVNEKRK